MFEIPVINLLQGFCSLPFGSPKETAVKLFGEPEEVQNLRDQDLSDDALIYHYWDQGYSLFFDVNRNQAFCSVEIDNKESLLFKVKIFTLKEKELVALLKGNGFGLTDTEVHKWGEKRLSFDTAGLDCYYENNKLVSVNFGILQTDNNFFYFPN